MSTNGLYDPVDEDPRRVVRRPKHSVLAIIAMAFAVIGTGVGIVILIKLCVAFPAGGVDACDDKNPCTQDLAWRGGCLNIPERNDVECESVCFNETDPQICNAGECSGTCLGECVLDADCPDITLLGTPEAAVCQNGVCVHKTAVPSGSDCGNDQFNSDQCDAFIAASNTLTECLVSNAVCDPLDNSLTDCTYTFACAEAVVTLII